MSDDYTRGFNEGYVIAEHLPDMAKSLSKIESASPRMEGFRDGLRQYAVEHLHGFRSAWLDVGGMGWRMGLLPGQTQKRDRDDREIER